MLSRSVKNVTQFSRQFSTQVKKFELPALPYEYSALEPAITGQIMETHHKKHHQTYVTNLNNSLDQLAEAQSKGDLTKQCQLTQAIKFNGGGHLNHSIFWQNLAPVSQGGGEIPSSGVLADQVKADFGSFDKLKADLSAASIGVQGSGWGWLGWNTSLNRMEITTCANQDPLVNMIPLLGIDVWEHAYYYKYGPARAEYLKNIWTIVNWRDVQQRLDKARSGSK